MPSPLGTPELDAMQDFEDQAYEEYEQWLSEWDGDYPNEREHATFSGWISQNEGLIRGDG